MDKTCKISGYTIRKDKDWTFVSNDGKYKMEIYLIGENIFLFRNYGYTTIHASEEVWPKLEEIIEKEQKNNKFFLIHDYANYKGADPKVRIKYVKWLNNNNSKILGIYIYNSNPFLKILLNSGKLLFKGPKKLQFFTNYEETILNIKKYNDINTKNDKIKWVKGFSFLSKNKKIYKINNVWHHKYTKASIDTYLLNNNIIFRRYHGSFTENIINKTINDFSKLLIESNIDKYHLFLEFSSDVSMSLSYRKRGVNWYNNNEKLLTAGFFNLSNFNRIIITLAKPFLTNKKLINLTFIQNDIKEAINVIENYENKSKEKVIKKETNINKLSKKELKEEVIRLRNKNKEILATQEIEINKLFNKLGRISWDENYDFNEKNFEIGNSPFNDLHNSLIVIQNDIKEILQKRNELVISAQESERLKSAFLANMSHEIRTPMNAIIGFADILRNLATNEKQKQFLNIISNSGEHLLNLINNIVDISKIQAEGLTLSLTNFDVNVVIKNIITELQVLKPNIKIEISSTNESLIINADKTRIKQIFINLLNNAIKFTEYGTITVGYEFNENNIVFFVKDTGIGIPKEEINNIFIKFTQANHSKNKINEGAGLGLTITKSIVESHNGRIWVESIINVGSTFYFTLPISCINNEYVDKYTLKNNLKLKFRNKKILIAEDKENNYLLLKEILNNNNTLIHAKNGFEAIDLYKSEKPDVILMDIQMPECNGFEATREIRKLNQNIPIIGQTAFAIKNPKENLIKKGFTNHIAKPINKSELFRILNELKL